jgi:uncharacterized membrane protein
VSALPAAAYELIAAPAAGALAFTLARRTLGLARAAVELGVLVLYGYALEWVVIAVFSSHRYAGSWNLAPGGVPVAVAVVWAALTLSALAVAARLGFETPLARARAAALLGLTLDLLMEPVAVRVPLWFWTPPGPWLGVPVGNFVGWSIILGVYAYGAERWGRVERIRHAAARRLVLGIVSIGVLVAAGLVWRATGAERLFAGPGGWVVWAALLVSTASLALRAPQPVAPDGLGGRLAQAPPFLALGVFLTIAVFFAIDALSSGEALLRLVALASCVVLAFIAERERNGGVLEWWRQRQRRALDRHGVLRVLMKRRNREPWSDEDRRFLRAELRSAARTLPALAVLLLPGGLLLLPLYAWLLDRRRKRRG